MFLFEGEIKRLKSDVDMINNLNTYVAGNLYMCFQENVGPNKLNLNS